MDEEETKNCPNCKRDIPASNFTIHTVHCARNIKVCPVCKEPVLAAELHQHHNQLHKLLPCKQCGESVCGTDLEDHIRDSCANTVKSCRYCELELPRRDLPAHEGYCGARTEQCPDCQEYVMMKYRQLHLDSNHGFIRLHDDPTPLQQVRDPNTRPRVTPAAVVNRSRPTTDNNTDVTPRPSLVPDAGPSNGFVRNEVRNNDSNGVKKRTNDQPQINMDTGAVKKIDKNLSISRGAVKKRPAPAPPRADPRRDLPYYGAMSRKQKEEQDRFQQNVYNMAHGLPPVLDPAAKLEKLRKMDALHNRETEPTEYRNRLRNRDNSDRPDNINRDGGRLGHGMARDDFKDLKPMSTEQFMARFNALQLQGGGMQSGGLQEETVNGGAVGARGDRFTEIKSSLRELRRGLNEVTAPYNNNSTINNNDRAECVRLPCEFCNELVPEEDLVQHQTGCRPDLAQYWGAGLPTPPAPAATPPRHSPLPAEDPVIPCEFCTQSLPVYLITEHQERCAREVDILSAD